MKTVCKRVISMLLAALMIISVFPKTEADAAQPTLNNPIKKVSSNAVFGRTYTYDCVWFGTYPQTEIVDKVQNSGAYGTNWYSEDYFEVDASLYNILKTTAGWNSKGEFTINGIKYKRVKVSDATNRFGTFAWNDQYHYFRFDPIKWRVLDTGNGELMLMSDKVLDCKRFAGMNSASQVTWEKSEIRSFLNGYEASANDYGLDYSGAGFLDRAFSSEEQNALLKKIVTNYKNEKYGTSAGNNTMDKVRLLSGTELLAEKFGFYTEAGYYDPAKMRLTTAYAAAMGVEPGWTSGNYAGGGGYWLRTPGVSDYNAEVVLGSGYLEEDGSVNYVNYWGVVPAVSVGATNAAWRYAGTVCTDGTMWEPGTNVSKLFDDVWDESWYHDAVQFVYDRNIMTGTTQTAFSPMNNLVRAQFAAVLWRMEGAPTMTYTSTFGDVGKGVWYTNAILWANKAGIVKGYDNGNFGPADNITRGQIAVMLFNYAKYKGLNTSSSASLNGFKDVQSVPSYAVNALKWAVAENIISGKENGTKLDPNGNATRAECASMIMRFMNKYGL